MSFGAHGVCMSERTASDTKGNPMAAMLTRAVADRQLPLPGTYAIDPAHSHVGFRVRHLGIATVRGRFTDFTGTITVAESPMDSAVHVSIRAASVDTAQPQRDAHVRSADFLAADDHPTLEFTSTDIAETGGTWTVSGDLTIRGRTRPVALAAEFDGAVPDVMADPAQPRISCTASTTIDRDEFGVAFNQPLATGGWLLGKQVRIDIDVQAARH